ncbi:MAG: S8 family serine peptidase [Nanoarchaeota archaeon]|nr:S8 family serine peptidase [Nanoarchaeota archaeon]MBU1945724.1 S8 family serine peptidase [Nanoarchaeota archaeon]
MIAAILASSAYSFPYASVEQDVYNQLNEKGSVEIEVQLKEAPQFNIASNKIQDKLSQLQSIRDKVKEAQNRVLSRDLGILVSRALNHIQVKYRYATIDGFSAVVDEAGLEMLKNNPNVESISYKRKLHILLDQSVPLINATKVWSIQGDGMNITGKGQTVCVVDTGIDYTHPALGDCTTAQFTNGTCRKVIGGYDYVNNDNNPMDDNSHGTHVAGIVASEDSTYKGVAPDAKLVAAKVCDSGGSCAYTTAGIDWCNDHYLDYNISVITISIGSNCADPPKCHYSSETFCYWYSSTMGDAISQAHNLSIFVDAASGNEGITDEISAPACMPYAVSVGSTTKSDSIYSTSNSGPNLDLLAPGSDITSTWLGGGFGSKTGTSMAAPHVAGAAALLKQYNTSLTPDDIEKKLERNGFNITDTRNSLTFPRIDVYNALEMSNPFVKTSGTQFYLNNKPFYFAGANGYFLWYGDYNCNKTNPSPNSGQCTSEFLDDAKAMNFTVIRTWGFADGPSTSTNNYWGSLQPDAGVYNETNFQKYDKLIKEAGDRNLKLIIPLINNWNHFGGMCQYAAWCNISGSCDGTSGTHDQFYTDSCTKELYKNYVSYFLNRTNTLTGIKYKDDPAVMAWELTNELRAKSDSTGNTVSSWVNEMGSYIKSIDSNHLLATGEEGFYVSGSRPEYGYHGEEGTDFIKNNQLQPIDFASMHIYNWSGYNNSLYWIEKHADDTKNILGKPIVAGELDAGQSDSSIQGWYNKIEENGLNGDTIWMLCPTNFHESGERCVYYPADNLSRFIVNHSNFMKSRANNQPPYLAPIGDIIVNESELVLINASATDPENDALYYSINDSRFSKDNNVFTWQTMYGDNGSYSFNVAASDGMFDSYQKVNVTVKNINKSCVVPYDGMNISENASLCSGDYFLPNGIRIVNSSLALNCNGARIYGNYTSSGVYFESVDNVTITNCILDGFTRGIYCKNCRNSEISKNKVKGNDYLIRIDSGYGNRIVSNELNGSYHIIRLFSSTLISIENNIITRYSGSGLSFDGAYNISIRNNTIYSGNNAIMCWYSCYYTQIEGNSFINNGIAVDFRNFTGDDRYNYHNLAVFHNNFIGSGQYYRGGGFNISFDFNNSGNYYSSYDCRDDNYDGFCDDPFQVTVNDIDRYPYTRQSGWLYDSILFKKKLIQGWNLISIPLNLSNWTVSSIFRNYSSIFTYDNRWIELTNSSKINETIGFWINILNNHTLQIEGKEFNNLTINLNQGWNLIGYPSLNKTNISEFFEGANITAAFAYNGTWLSYNPSRNDSLNTLKQMKPGYGYWVKTG